MIGAVFGITTKGFNSGLNLTVGIGADGKIKGRHNGRKQLRRRASAKKRPSHFRDQFIGKPYDSPFKKSSRPRPAITTYRR